MGVVDSVAEGLIVAALVGELLLVLANVADRVYFRHSFLWSDEAARLTLSILAFIGGAVAYRRRDHAFVRIVLNIISGPGERACLAVDAGSFVILPHAGQQAIFREESTAAGDLMRKLIADQEENQIKKIEASGMQVTRPDLAPFRALMGPAYERIAAYAGADNVKKFQQMAEQGHNG